MILGTHAKFKMKTFKDLKFKPHPSGFGGYHARMNFRNGYGISVVRFNMPFGGGYGSYTDNENEWECGILHENQLCYDSGLADNVIGHLKKSNVSELMVKIQKLKKK